MFLIRVRVHKRLVYIFQIILYLVVRRAYDRLKAKPADQGDTACHLFHIQL